MIVVAKMRISISLMHKICDDIFLGLEKVKNLREKNIFGSVQ